MITARGKVFIKRYFAGQSASAIGALSVGLGGTAAAVLDERLNFEWGRVPISFAAYDYTTDKVVFKCTLPEEFAGKIYEIALWTSDVDANAGNQGSKTFVTFDSKSEAWIGGAFETVNSRIGPDALKHSVAASSTMTSSLSSISLSFFENSSADQFLFAYNVDNLNVSTIKFRFRTDASNYYEYSVAAPTVGYKVTPFEKGSATVVGSPNWANINEIVVETTAKASGIASVTFDGMRIEDVDTVSPDYGMVTRYVLPAPIDKEEGRVLDIEYALNVTA